MECYNKIKWWSIRIVKMLYASYILSIFHEWNAICRTTPREDLHVDIFNPHNNKKVRINLISHITALVRSKDFHQNNENNSGNGSKK